MLTNTNITYDQSLQILKEGEASLRGRLPHGSNVAYLVDLQLKDRSANAVYKPILGEMPLWDFPLDLAYREQGAFLVDKALGWNTVPPTVIRSDLPFGLGSMQLFVPFQPEHHYGTIAHDQQLRPQLERICALDVVINNADRKAGHCLLGVNNKVWAIDNSLSFHHDFKLRTVIWDFANNKLPIAIRQDLQRLLDTGLPKKLVDTLAPLEIEATLGRTHELLHSGCFPAIRRGLSNRPWPLV